MNIEITEEFQKSIELINNTNKNLFITGNAGTGKSTLLEYIKNNTKKNIVVLAPTGVSALNIKGQTIHSFFGFKPNVSEEKVTKKKSKVEFFKKIETIIIDEVSMLRSDLVDCIDKFLKLNREQINLPFGGVQIIFIGDLFQLPPVVNFKDKEILKDKNYESPYFFSSKIFKDLKLEFLELKKIYRQKDLEFINLLNKIRNKQVFYDDIVKLNTRYKKEYIQHENEITICTTNKRVEEINNIFLKKLQGKDYKYECEKDGEVNEKSLPTSETLKLKIESQIMMLNNDSKNRWVNGSIGKIIDIENEGYGNDILIIKFKNGKIYPVELHKWDIINYEYNNKTKKIKSKIVGSFIQYPLKLAWAITIHKSQGQTFDNIIVDIGNGTFAHGQVYVALSRCTNFEGITLSKPIYKRHILLDNIIKEFSKNIISKENS